MLAKIKAHVAVAVATLVALAHRAATFALAVRNSAQGTIVAGELRKAIVLATAAGSIAGGFAQGVDYIAHDQVVIAALGPVVTILAAKVGVALPGPLATAAVAFALTHLAAAVVALHLGKPAAQAVVGAALVGIPPRPVRATESIVEVTAQGRDLGALGAEIGAKYGLTVTRQTPAAFGDYLIVHCPAMADGDPLCAAIEADFPGTRATHFDETDPEG